MALSLNPLAVQQAGELLESLEVEIDVLGSVLS
jgi:hypothetical protein